MENKMQKVHKMTKSLSGFFHPGRKSKDSSNIKSASATLKRKNSRSSVTYIRPTQNFQVLWLDSYSDKINDEDSINTTEELHRIVNTVWKFTSDTECAEFIKSVKDEEIFLICSGRLGQRIVPIIHDLVQLNSMYIFCEHPEQHKQWTRQWQKIIDIYTEIEPICEVLKQAAQNCDQNSVSISFIKTSDSSSINHIDQSFIYADILKDVLFSADFQPVSRDKFLMSCRERFTDNITELKNINELDRDYNKRGPIWWYTYSCLLYSMVNRALRLIEIDRINTMAFFIRDLHNQIDQLHTQQYLGQSQAQTFTVYRGQGLSRRNFEQLQATRGGLLSFNNFLFTSTNANVAIKSAQQNAITANFIGVLFSIKIDPTVRSTPFANVKNVSCCHIEEEILFSIHSIFRIEQVKPMEKMPTIWKIHLTLIDDNDSQLNSLNERLQTDTFSQLDGWYRLGYFLIEQGQFDRAQQVLDISLEQTTDEKEKANIYDMIGIIKDNQGKYEDAIKYNKQALEICERTLPGNHPYLATCYNNIGNKYNNMNEYIKALSSYEKALEIDQRIYPEYHPNLAISYNNIGNVYNNMGEYAKAISFHETALEIQIKVLPTDHHSLGTTYNNIGYAYKNMGEYADALSYHEKALKIRQKTLPANHPELITSYNSLGTLHITMQKYPKALSCFEKVIELCENIHPYLAIAHNNMGLVYYYLHQYSDALSHYEKALQIFENTLPEKHPDLATAYYNIGLVYHDKGDYSEARSHYEDALHIRQHSLPPDHPSIEEVEEKMEIVENKL